MDAKRVPARVTLTEQEREWLRRKWALIRESEQIADQANKDWKRINASINARIAETDRRRLASGDPRGPLTPTQKAQIKSDSLPLKDALDTGKWHAENARRHMDSIKLFLHMRELGVL